MKAVFRFNSRGDIIITTPENTEHKFESVSRAVNWCRDNNIEAYPA